MTPENEQGPATDAPAQRSSHKVSVIYRAGDGDPVSTTWRGVTFIKDKPVEFDESNERDFGIVEAARGNPSFDVGGEDKAQQRADDEHRRTVEAAEVELAGIDSEAEAIEKRHTAESNEMEARHSAEREAFLNGREARAIELRRIIRGSDGTDDLQPADDGAQLNPDPGAPESQPAGIGQTGAPPPAAQPIEMPPSNGGDGNPPTPAQPAEKPTDPAAPAPAANQAPEPVRQTNLPEV